VSIHLSDKAGGGQEFKIKNYSLLCHSEADVRRLKNLDPSFRYRSTQDDAVEWVVTDFPLATLLEEARQSVSQLSVKSARAVGGGAPACPAERGLPKPVQSKQCY